jgi:hypothetical protein
MNYPKPPPRASVTLVPPKNASPTDTAISESLLLDALTVVVLSAREKGQTLAELKAEVLADDMLLDITQRRLLSDIVAKAWERMPASVQTMSISENISDLKAA